MYINAENPFGTDAFSPATYDPIKNAPRTKKKVGERRLPTAPRLKHLAVKLMML